MIITALLFIILGIIGYVFSLLPTATIASLPIIGEGLSNLLYSMMSTWNAFLVTFPYAQLAWNLFLFVIIPFEIALLTIKFFLGSRVPANVE